MKVIVTGATGLIGKKIAAGLINCGEDVVVFSRNPKNARKLIVNAADYVYWNYENPDNKGWTKHLTDADAVIHLAGENVMSRRWNREHKDKILKSRVLGTKSLVDIIADSENKLKSFISASAVGYYGYSETDIFDEESGAANTFLATVTEKWEKEVSALQKSGVREARIRLGIVLDKNEGALAKMVTPFKFFIGGPIGNGKQWFPWVHIDDVVGLFLFILYSGTAEGVFNAVAPGFITMRDFAKSLGSVMKRPSIFTVPSFALKILFGEGAAEVLNGQKVISERTEKIGYKFKFTNVEEALKDILL
ncbi:MAG: TIGR01777 family oxidoreductase [Melioribacteraceae bacterium]|nr:TIGR01777 family oxidoreductase [Melioribacteraceae bacterium]